MNDWNNVQQLGIVWVTLLLDDPNEGPATSAGAENWANQYGLVDAYVLADPGFSMVVGSSVGTPMFTVIDPRTMTVTYKQEGSAGPGVHPELEALANKNKAAQ